MQEEYSGKKDIVNQRKIGVILSYLYTGIHIAVNMLYVPLLLNTIGQSEYGLYQLIGSIISYFSIMESLLSAGILRFYCKYHSIGDEEKKENILAVSQRIYYFLAMIVIVFGAVCIFVFEKVYQKSLSPFEISESKWMLILLIINIVVSLTNYVYTAVITANEKFVFLKLLSIITTVLQPLAVLAVINKAPYAVSIVAVQLVLNIIFAFIKRFYSKNRLHAVIKYHYRDDQFITELFSLSFGIFLTFIANQIFWKTDQLIIAKMLDTKAVAVYAIGAQIYLNYSPVGTAISGVFMPRLSVLYDRDHNLEGISELFIKVGRISFLVLGMVLLGFILFGQEFILIWAGKGYTESYYIAVLVMVPLTIDVMQNMGLSILQLVNKYGFKGKMYLALAVFNIFTTIYLVRGFGIVGAAFSTAAAMALGNGIIMNLYYQKSVGLNIKKFWREIAAMIPGLAAASGIGYLIRIIHLENRYAAFLLHIVLFSAAYLLCTYLLSMNDYEKLMIKKVYNKIKH